jgi:SNF2 family DNA or RNA helicase
MKFRDYQLNIIEKGLKVLKNKKLLYLSMEVRTGKTLTSLGICEKLKVENVLFITKKKAISSISSDYDKMCPVNFTMFTINYESIHKIPDIKWDVIICDEAHSMGAFPKPSKRAKTVKELIQDHQPYVILMSGTPTPESFSQMYHQVYGVPGNPFSKYRSFYKFAGEYVRVVQKKINGYNINDYSNGLTEIIEEMKPYTISYSQKEAGFKSTINEKVLLVPISQKVTDMISVLRKDLVYEIDGEYILGDTAVKLMTKMHQMYSGTVKFESGKRVVLDLSKANFIKEKFDGQKIGIFYKFQAELIALREVFGDSLCTTLEEFDSTDKNIALQIVSGREGISLRKADFLVYYNIDFSATSYWQSRDRMTTKERMHNNIYWIFSEKGIEKMIYKAVNSKKDYTLRHFKRDYAI